MAKTKMYKCNNCGTLNTHIDSYNDKYCYDCINIDTGELKKDGGVKKIVEKIIAKSEKTTGNLLPMKQGKMEKEMNKQNILTYMIKNDLKIIDLKILKFLNENKKSKKTHFEKIGINYYQIKFSLIKLIGLGLVKDKNNIYTIDKKNKIITKLFEEIA